MKLNFPKASELRKQVTIDREVKKQVLKDFVTNWLNAEVLPEIEKSASRGGNSVMVESPIKSYDWGKEFYAEIQRQIGPLGYNSEKSHDGGGMYDTCIFYWESKK